MTILVVNKKDAAHKRRAIRKRKIVFKDLSLTICFSNSKFVAFPENAEKVSKPGFRGWEERLVLLPSTHTGSYFLKKYL